MIPEGGFVKIDTLLLAQKEPDDSNVPVLRCPYQGRTAPSVLRIKLLCSMINEHPSDFFAAVFGG